jgi:hypothetical protein
MMLPSNACCHDATDPNEGQLQLSEALLQAKVFFQDVVMPLTLDALIAIAQTLSNYTPHCTPKTY